MTGKQAIKKSPVRQKDKDEDDAISVLKSQLIP